MFLLSKRHFKLLLDRRKIQYVTVCSADIRRRNEDVINSSRAQDGTRADTGGFALFKVKPRRLRALIKAD